MCNELQNIQIEDDHALSINVRQPLFETLEDFEKLKGLLEESIDINRARQNEYLVKADFDKDLKELRTQTD